MEGPSSLAGVSWPAQGSNLGLSAGEALTTVLQQLSGPDQQAADSSREVAQQQITDSLSILDGADYAASAVDVVEPTLEQFTDADDVADELASAAEQLEDALTAPQATDALMGEDIAGDDGAVPLWFMAQRVLSWLMGCPHGPMSLMSSQSQLPAAAQLQVTGSSEGLPAATLESPSALLQQSDVVRPLKITMLLNSVLPGQSVGMLQPQMPAAVPDQTQEEPLMMQKDGVLQPQNLANFLQSLNTAHAAPRLLPADEPTSSQPQMLVPQTSGLMQPQSRASVLQQLPWIVFGNYMRGEAAVLSHEAQPAAAKEAELLTATARAAIPGQNGATVVLSSAQSSGQDILEQVGENFGEAQNAQDGSFPSREAVAVASAELAQNLGISQEQALDRVVSAVLQQRMGGSPEWVRDAEGQEADDSLTAMDSAPAAENDDAADDAIWEEVTAVPPQAGPDDREGMLQRVAAFLDQLLGRAAQALRPKADLTAEDVAEDVEGPVVLATASGRGPAEVRPWAYNAEQSRVLEGVSADSYFVEPSLVADDLPEQPAVPVHAMAPLSANTHNNAAAVPLLAPEPVLALASGLIDHGAAAFVPAPGPTSSKVNANAHNNAV